MLVLNCQSSWPTYESFVIPLWSCPCLKPADSYADYVWHPRRLHKRGRKIAIGQESELSNVSGTSGLLLGKKQGHFQPHQEQESELFIFKGQEQEPDLLIFKVSTPQTTWLVCKSPSYYCGDWNKSIQCGELDERAELTVSAIILPQLVTSTRMTVSEGAKSTGKVKENAQTRKQKVGYCSPWKPAQLCAISIP